VATRCPKTGALFTLVPAYAPSTGASGPSAAGPRRTLALVDATLREAVATWLMTAAISGERTTVAGLGHGTISSSLLEIRLDGYGVEPGVRVTGRIAFSVTPPLGFTGSVTVHGPRAAAGSVTVDRNALRGVLGGTAVRR
jgi:hypothetical protein